MDSFTLSLLAVIVFGGQLLIGHILYTLRTSEEELRRMLANQRDEIAALTEEIEMLWSENRRLAGDIDTTRRDFNLRELYSDKSPSWAEAIEMVRQGAPVEELVLHYGLNESEARLIVNNYRESTPKGTDENTGHQDQA